jgi:hypothetical protein
VPGRWRARAKAIAISHIKAGRERYYTSVGGRQAEVRVIRRGDQCASEYLRSDPDVSTTNNLLWLPNEPSDGNGDPDYELGR